MKLNTHRPPGPSRVARPAGGAPARRLASGLRTRGARAGRGRRAVLAVVLAVLGLGGTSAAALASTAVLLEPQLEGALQPAEQSRLRLAAQKGLQAQGFILTPDSDLEVALAGEPQLKSCHSELCRERLGRLLDAQVVARYRIKTRVRPGKQSPDWHLNVEILDVEVGALGAGLTEDCADCALGQAADQLSDMIRRAVLQSAARPRGVLEVFTQPPGASVFVDGSELGITPYKRSAFVGKHKLVLRHTGYRSQQAEVEVDETQRRRTDLKLAPGTDPVQVVVVEKEKTPVYKKWWFWVAIGGAAVAAAAITAGAVLGSQAASERTLPANTYMFMF